ncbi:hypothetical protein [Caenimonas aquaedulcis]|uniref:Uncharacterized protein n=1 Tax=Caenimonas aquaedulcis TaxID=2793270 RepID=A0A931H2Y1_9BURK|nr:hypothetical protein [Caenimonas aquaedulcis]MBG9387552.1 hypothetical protein [Caenimonas aquaedulcis]
MRYGISPFAVGFGVLLWAGAIAGTAEAPSGLIGQWRSPAKRVCVSDARTGRPACSRISDAVSIERTSFGGARDVKVQGEFTLPNAQLCQFEGLGYWDARSRRLEALDRNTGCEIALAPVGRELRGTVSNPHQCRSPCAGTSWLEGVALRRR